MSISRRQFLKSGAAMCSAGALSPFALNLAAIGNAAAQSSNDDYKALICIFLAGGNDGFNTVLATDPDSWREYQRLRGANEAGNLALPPVGSAGGVLPLNPRHVQSGRSFALHPALGALHTLFDAQRLAIIANVGPLLAPLNKNQYLNRSAPLPPKLFSHNDQQSVWQAYAPEGARVGWGGRLADLLGTGNQHSTFSAISTAGNTVFLAGRDIIQYQISSAGAVAIRNLEGNLFGAKGASNPFKNIISGSRSDLFEQAHANVVARSIQAQSLLAAAMVPAGANGIPDPSAYINPNTGLTAANPLAVQLQSVARIIAGRNALGAKRQVFYVTLPGFDTHDQQKATQADLLAKLAHGMAYFDGLMGNLQGVDMRSKVTLFTASEFGRTFTSNGDGSDHGWGNHHFVCGGAVRGQDIYGEMPITGIGHALDVGSGSLLPTMAVDQYAATLATWFGLDNSQLFDVFPNLVNFADHNVGFML